MVKKTRANSAGKKSRGYPKGPSAPPAPPPRPTYLFRTLAGGLKTLPGAPSTPAPPPLRAPTVGSVHLVAVVTRRGSRGGTARTLADKPSYRGGARARPNVMNKHRRGPPGSPRVPEGQRPGYGLDRRRGAGAMRSHNSPTAANSNRGTPECGDLVSLLGQRPLRARLYCDVVDPHLRVVAV